jgi:hypothetical protein
MCPSPSPPPLLPHWQFSGRQNPGGPIERTSELFSCDPRNTAGFFVVAAGLLLHAASLEINHAHDHCAVRVEGQILDPPSTIARAHRIVERVCDNAEAADLSGGSERRAQREQKERTGVALSLMILVDRKLAEQCHRHWVGFVALL